MKWRMGDVVVMTWPKCGTTWMQEIIWTMRNNPDLNNPLADMSITSRVPFIDMDMFMLAETLQNPNPDNPLLSDFLKVCPGANPADGVQLQLATVMPDPRTIKTHIPLSLLHPTILDNSKVVFVARNPRDVIVSLHHHYRIVKSLNFTGSMDNFVNYFVNDKLLYGPYWLHVQEAWAKRHHPNFHFIFYEDLKADIMTELNKLNKFLGLNLTKKQLCNVADYTSFNRMAARDKLLGPKTEDNPMFFKEIVRQDGGFFRKGTVCSWKEKLSPEMVNKIDQWTTKNLREIPFRYSL
ncbi:Luciferin sulfotransferase-like 1 [Homarus americanus]|uniref:Luciferin sulfotransferase-like 1 n=1 Tax=Homarus americanus TaxID=6706 RepID=A0A8J5J829_HOMAM|nr:Luciferin sulfotransferase-like 1 [Homarus americanus]